MMKYYEVRGKKIYTEILGPEAAPVLLFIHGGPGGIGVADFIEYQGSRLSKDFKIVAPDQRGVWRSEAITSDEDISLEDLIEDYEALRKKLHIKRWSLLSHSFGGYLAVLYANLYPDSIECIVFESPSFSFALSERSLLKAAANEFAKLGNIKLAEKYFSALKEVTDFKAINKLLMKASNELGDNCNNYMWFGQDKGVINRLAKNTLNAKELWGKSSNTRNRLLQDWRVYENVFSELSKINKPSLLIRGEHDPITCDAQVNEFSTRVPENEVVVFEYSSHWTRIEEPDKYSKVITDFINKLK